MIMRKKVVGMRRGKVIVQNLLKLLLQSIMDASIIDFWMFCKPAKKKIKFALICFHEAAINT